MLKNIVKVLLLLSCLLFLQFFEGRYLFSSWSGRPFSAFLGPERGAHGGPLRSPSFKVRQDLSSSQYYLAETIVATIQTLVISPARLLVYDPTEDSFFIYTVSPKSDASGKMMLHGWTCGRCTLMLPMLVDSLLQSQSDSRPFSCYSLMLTLSIVTLQ
jgi:hypothetical protein